MPFDEMRCERHDSTIAVLEVKLESIASDMKEIKAALKILEEERNKRAGVMMVIFILGGLLSASLANLKALVRWAGAE